MVLSREADAERTRRKSADRRLVVIELCADPERRARLELDTEGWLRFYLAHKYTNPFSEAQRDIIRSLDHFFVHGGDQSIAAPRGEGKSSLAQDVGIKYVLTGALGFLLLFGATGTDAEQALADIKRELEENEILAADYPEVCLPIQALNGAPQRARSQIVSSKEGAPGEAFSSYPSRFEWSGREVTLPRVPGSRASESVIMTRGLDAAVRGCKKYGKRPDRAIIDDPDTEETAVSEEQTAKLEKKIDRAIAGLGGQKKTISRLLLCTLQNNRCVSAKYTDPKCKPSFKGRRYKFLMQKPERLDLWEEYVALWQQCVIDDEFCRKAHQFYLENREAMDAGAKVANVFRFDDTPTPDGSPLEVSAIQHYYNFVAKNDWDAAACELDNDPPQDKSTVEHGITAHRVQTQVNGLERKAIPPSAILITQGIDCRKVALHWVVRAWDQDGTGYTIDYGVTEVRGTVHGSDEGVDQAIYKAILERKEQVLESPYRRSNGEIMPLETTLVDAGWRTPAVYLACKHWGLGVQPAMGFGKSNGCAGASFRDQLNATDTKQPGDGWFMSLKKTEDGDIWLVAMDTDRWKAYEQDRWMTDLGKAGSMTLYGQPGPNPLRMSEDQRNHHSYSRHITSESEVEEVVRGVLVRKWKAKSDNNHWLDASYMSHVAANMRNIRLARASAPVIVPAPITYHEPSSTHQVPQYRSPSRW